MVKKLIKRHIFSDLIKDLDKKEVTLIVGPRQAGKTFLMNLLVDYLKEKGEQTLFLSLDFDADKKYFVSQENLLAKLDLELGNKKGFVFIDEIQRKTDAGLFLKGIYDRNLPYKFIVSGSGSLELKEKIHESLAGRKMIFEMRPVSFFEFADFKTDYRYENELGKFFEVEEDKTLRLFEEYLNFGGYPAVILAETALEKTRVIDEIYKSYISRDISLFLKINKPDAFESLIKVLAGQIGGVLNYSEISATLGISLATVKNYLYYLENTFILKLLTPFFKNVRKEMTKSPSVYFYDPGIRNYALGAFGNLGRPDDLGFLFQNFVWSELNERIRYSNIKLNYWRTKDKAEVDFVLSAADRIIPIEAKYQKFDQPILERSLRSFIDKYHPVRAAIINKDFKSRIVLDGATVDFLPFWELMNWQP